MVVFKVHRLKFKELVKACCQYVALKYMDFRLTLALKKELMNLKKGLMNKMIIKIYKIKYNNK